MRKQYQSLEENEQLQLRHLKEGKNHKKDGD